MFQRRINEASSIDRDRRPSVRGRGQSRKERIEDSLHKLERGSAPPGQLERPVKRIPEHDIVRTNGREEPPSTKHK